MATYATQADFEAYVEGYVTDNPAALERTLQKAERDVDRFLSHALGTPFVATGLRIDPTVLEGWIADGLSRAVCAQAEYRMAKGEDFFVETQFPVGEFASTSKTEPRFSPKAKEELSDVGLLVTSGRISG